MTSLPSLSPRRDLSDSSSGTVAASAIAPSRRPRQTTRVVPIRRIPQSFPVPGISRPIEVKIASSADEWEQAFALAAASYQERGYETPGVGRLRFTPYHALPDTVTLIAKHGAKVVATFSIVLDNVLLGLPMESAYPQEIAALRNQGRRMFEATTLADDELNVREFIQVFINLIKLSMQYHTYQGGDTYVIAVNPRHRKFYTKIMGFVPLGPLRSYAVVQDAPAEAFLLNNELHKANAPDTYAQTLGEQLPPEVLFAPKMPRELIRQFSRQSSLCDIEQIDKILAVTDEHGRIRRW